MKALLSPEEIARLEAAVAVAERRTAGEIVPVIVPQSGRYPVAVWRGAALAAVAAMALVLLVYTFYDGWGLGWLYAGSGVALAVLVAGTAGGLLTAAVPALKRLLAGRALLDEQVHLRALQAFVEEEVFNTSGRTGILLFVSLFEHRIEVLGDAGINAKVEADEWVELVTHLREHVRQGRLADGLLEAFSRCGGLLERCGVAIQPDDVDELSNEVRIRRQP